MPEPEKKEKFGKFVNGLLRASLGDDVTDPLGRLIADHATVFEDPKDTSVLKNTNFASYRKALFDIVKMIYSKGKRDEIKQLFSNIPENDLYAMTQSMVRLNKRLPYLDKKHEKITRQVVEKYVSIYDELAGHMEKLAAQMFGIKELLGGKKIEYSDLKKRKLSDCVASLLTVPEFAELIRPLNVTIRNAIAHKHVIFEPLARSVKFVDKHKTVALKYEEFIAQTRELYAALLITSHVETALNLQLWKIVEEYISK